MVALEIEECVEAVAVVRKREEKAVERLSKRNDFSEGIDRIKTTKVFHRSFNITFFILKNITPLTSEP